MSGGLKDTRARPCQCLGHDLCRGTVMQRLRVAWPDTFMEIHYHSLLEQRRTVPRTTGEVAGCRLWTDCVPPHSQIRASTQNRMLLDIAFK